MCNSFNAGMPYEFSPGAELVRTGILDVDPYEYLTQDDDESCRGAQYVNTMGEAPKLNIQPACDEFKSSNTGLPEQSSWKKWAAGALALYLGGLAISKGKVNPMEWGKPIQKLFNRVVSFVGWVFKKPTP